MLFRETISVYYKNQTKHTNTLWGRMQSYVKAGGTYSNRWALKG
jgi:hypothetical protein